ncbi:MAG TPA: SagB/ThcOx family dehydrogenase [Clostridia bacterium]|nr:SagB/ThcOx family dehydrogenase [Clostridia bacterium]
MNKIGNIIKILKISKSREFNNHTKIDDFSKYKTTPYSKWPAHWKKIYYKAYPRMEKVLLPNPTKTKLSLHNALMQRESIRDYTKKNINLNDFSDLMFYSGGLKKLALKNTGDKRFYPSAGARYPLEIYPFVFKVENLMPAIYHYHVKSHSLEKIYDKPFFNATMKQFNQPWIRKASVLLVISSIFDRTEDKYGDRGLRHIYTEYGHYAQNISLVASELGLRACSVGGFIDDGLNKLLDLDRIDESAIGVIALGTV